jgi:hypothetical protein
VRRGPTVLEWLWIAEQPTWVDTRETQDPSAARGLQNPHEVLELMAANADAAVDRGEQNGRRVLELSLQGDQLRKFLKDYLSDMERDVKWKDSKSSARLELDPKTLLPLRVKFSADVESAKGKIRYDGEVVVESYGKEKSLRFEQDGMPIELTPDARKKLGLD